MPAAATVPAPFPPPGTLQLTRLGHGGCRCTAARGSPSCRSRSNPAPRSELRGPRHRACSHKSSVDARIDGCLGNALHRGLLRRDARVETRNDEHLRNAPRCRRRLGPLQRALARLPGSSCWSAFCRACLRSACLPRPSTAAWSSPCPSGSTIRRYPPWGCRAAMGAEVIMSSRLVPSPTRHPVPVKTHWAWASAIVRPTDMP